MTREWSKTHAPGSQAVRRLREAERCFVQVNEAKARMNRDTLSPYDVAFFHATL